MNAHIDQTRKRVQLLAYAGLTPFVGLAVLLWLVDADLHPFVALALTGYGAVIVSFLGGIHWGIGFRNAARMHNAPLFNFVWGVVPSLLAWIAISIPRSQSAGMVADAIEPHGGSSPQLSDGCCSDLKINTAYETRYSVHH